MKKVGQALHPTFIFIKPPSHEELVNRLLARKTETADSLSARLKTAEEEIKFAEENPGFHDYVVVNDDVNVAYEEFSKIILG